MGLTHFPNGVSSYGVPQIGMGGFIPSGGNVYWVHPASTLASDGNTGLAPDKPLSTLSQAHTLMTANQNDVAIVVGNSSASSANVVSETATLTWSKDLCHIIGTGYNRISHRVSIRAVTNNFTPLVSVTADGCVFANFHTFHGYATSEAQICWAETGQRNAYYNVHMGGMGAQLAADHADSRVLTLSGDGERYFSNCTFGLDTVDRGAANATIGYLSQAVRDIFEDCYFIMRADTTTPTHILADTSLIIDRFQIFKNCNFYNGGTFTGGSTPIEVMNVHASVGGVFIMQGSHFTGFDAWEDVASTRVYVENAQAAATTGLMVAATT